MRNLKKLITQAINEISEWENEFHVTYLDADVDRVLSYCLHPYDMTGQVFVFSDSLNAAEYIEYYQLQSVEAFKELGPIDLLEVFERLKKGYLVVNLKGQYSFEFRWKNGKLYGYDVYKEIGEVEYDRYRLHNLIHFVEQYFAIPPKTVFDITKTIASSSKHIYKSTIVLRQFSVVFRETEMNVEVWRVHECCEPEYYYGIYIPDQEKAALFMDEDLVKNEWPMFIGKRMFCGKEEWLIGAGYLDWKLPKELGPFLDEAAGMPLPPPDIDNPFLNYHAHTTSSAVYNIEGYGIEKQKGIYSDTWYYRVINGKGPAMVIVRTPSFFDEGWDWLPELSYYRPIEILQEAGKLIDEYETREGTLEPPRFKNWIPADKLWLREID